MDLFILLNAHLHFTMRRVIAMSNENKIRILYVQPGKYPEERFVVNELHPLQRLVGEYGGLTDPMLLF